ncbi:type IV pilus modification PilV family protein [Alkalicoccus chagannorensis]|uniref:type IV pilus modification PilV family protein n=1 Tax=Alkalicoccus chagannorensis TaxID=427072 RepID=UPI000685DD35|nr:type II secretion system protein [Alkalicoccus chagannorensis]
MKIDTNEAGVSLLETLAAITILGIIMITFMSVFSQAALFSSRAETELTAVHAAEIVLSDVRNEAPQENDSTREVTTGEGHDFTAEVRLEETPEESDSREAQLGLQRLHILIYEDDTTGAPLYDTYTFVEEESGS